MIGKDITHCKNVDVFPVCFSVGDEVMRMYTACQGCVFMRMVVRRGGRRRERRSLAGFGMRHSSMMDDWNRRQRYW